MEEHCVSALSLQTSAKSSVAEPDGGLDPRVHCFELSCTQGIQEGCNFHRPLWDGLSGKAGTTFHSKCAERQAELETPTRKSLLVMGQRRPLRLDREQSTPTMRFVTPIWDSVICMTGVSNKIKVVAIQIRVYVRLVGKPLLNGMNHPILLIFHSPTHW